jgi:hypothetical protein
LGCPAGAFAVKIPVDHCGLGLACAETMLHPTGNSAPASTMVGSKDRMGCLRKIT